MDRRRGKWSRMTAYLGSVVLASLLCHHGEIRAGQFLSHPPIRPLPKPSQRPMSDGPGYFLAPTGDDANAGTKEKPWKTLNAAMTRLKPGDTLYLRGGTYFENVYCAIVGAQDKPITFRSFPGEVAILDGGIPEFQTDPANAWEPVQGGGAGEYRSKQAYPNIRDVVGRFADSYIGLQTYWHPEDLRTNNEVNSNGANEETGQDVIYCGPGIWYNRETSHIHVRLAHTHLQSPYISNYTGETDPRKMPLIIAPYNSLPLHVDLAQHVNFYDLVIRGGGLNAVRMDVGMDINFDHVLIYTGTYGMRSKGSGPVKFLNSAIYGGIAPWDCYIENALHVYTPVYSEPYADGTGANRRRNIARLTSHALMVLEGYEESDVFAYPFNNRWEIAWSEFADGHDGIYPDGKSIRVHDNWIGNMEDDATYLSGPTRRVSDDMHLYRNYITGCTSVFAFHGRGGPEGSIYIYGNVADCRFVGRDSRLRTNKLDVVRPYGFNFFNVHGTNGMFGIESVYMYNNTAILMGDRARSYLGMGWVNAMPGSTRHIMNNLFVYTNGCADSGIPAYVAKDKIVIDGNLHWSPDKPPPADYLKAVRALGFEAHSVVGSPEFKAFSESVEATNDYRIGQGAATGAAVPVPKEIESKLEPGVVGKDIGAYQTGAEVRKVGIDGRITVGAPTP